MQRSLTVLLPVHNAQSTLAATVLHAIEVAPELAERVEVVIIDDGSTDATCEVAAELSHQYPQVSFLRHGQRLGREATIEAGLRRCGGEVVLVGEGSSGTSIDEISKQLRDAPPSCMDPHTSALAPHKAFFEEEAAPSPLQPSDGVVGYHLIDRRIPGPVHGPSQPAGPNFLKRLARFALGE